MRILESNPEKNEEESDDDSENVNVTLYTSIGLGVVAIILLALIILFMVKLRKQNNEPVVETNELYAQHVDYYEDQKAATVTDTNDYYLQ